MKKIWVFSLEPLESRYTKQWHQHLPNILKERTSFEVVQIDGIQKNSQPTPGAFLNFSDTNYWKSSQLCKFLEELNAGSVGDQDHLIFTDAWNPVVLQIKYMRDLLNKQWILHGLWHAGSYDPHDFLGRLIGDALWVRNTESAMFYAFDHNYFATNFHIDLFCKNLFDTSAEDVVSNDPNKIVRTGWPMEYLKTHVFEPSRQEQKENLILFPHRLAPEKQPEIFRDLAASMPQYNFVVCQDTKLSKDQYHSLLKKSKMVFSANLQETLGISWYEGLLANSIPMVPDRLSYSEMAFEEFKYPSDWTESFDQYRKHKKSIMEYIEYRMENHSKYHQLIIDQTESLSKNYFSAAGMYSKINSYV